MAARALQPIPIRLAATRILFTAVVLHGLLARGAAAGDAPAARPGAPAAYPVVDREWRGAVRCGHNALYMFLKCAGWRGTLSDVYDAVPTTERGCNLLQLKNAAEQFGVSVVAAKATGDTLRSLPMPVITHHDSEWSPDGQVGHFLLVAEAGVVAPNGSEQVHVVDPITLVERDIPTSEFGRSWTGHILCKSEGRRGRFELFLGAAMAFLGAFGCGWWLHVAKNRTT